MYNTETRDALVGNLRKKGIESGGCGAYTIRLRPSMVFMPQHAAQFLEIFDQVCRSLGLHVGQECLSCSSGINSVEAVQMGL